MQEFDDGSQVRVTDLERTKVICGTSLSTAMEVGSEQEVQEYDDSDDTYRLSDGCWYSAVDLEAVVVKQELTIEDFKRGSIVQLVSTDATDREFGYTKEDEGRVHIGESFTVGEVDDTDGSVEDDNECSWYSIEDLIIISKADTSELTASDVEVGQRVSILRTENSANVFGVTEVYEVGDTFEIKEVDEEDDSVSTGDDWIFLADVELVDSDLDDATDEEWDVPGDEVNFLITRDSVTLSINGDSEVATVDHTNFATIRQHIMDEEFNEAMALMNVAIGIQSWGQGALSIDNGKILYAGMELTGKLVDRIIDQMVNGDTEFERFAKFLNLTMEQESFKTRERLMDFAAHGKLDINENGFVVAFKNVRDDFMDKHTRTFDNNVGMSPSMRRSDVDDNHDNQCSQGLHVCSPEYLSGFWGTSGKTMRVLVDPRDFVAIPYDYNDSKARVCKYTVVEDVTDKINEYL